MLTFARKMLEPSRQRRPTFRLVSAIRSATYLFGLPFVLVLFVAFTGSAQAPACISIRVLDGKSGKPVEGLITFVLNSSNDPIGKTDENGLVQFCPKDPSRKSLSLYFKRFAETDPGGNFDTEAALKTGIVTNNAFNKGKFHDRETPKPGEIVVFGRRWWLIDRWLDQRLGEWP